MIQAEFKFDGSDYIPERDNERLTRLVDMIFNLMKDSKYRTLEQISDITKSPQASVSAHLRHLRKQKFGSHTVNKKYMGDGLYTYQLIVNKQ